ncbi:MAG: hypothetical protein ACRD2E_06150 [Terriglobales bacterium]
MNVGGLWGGRVRGAGRAVLLGGCLLAFTAAALPSRALAAPVQRGTAAPSQRAPQLASRGAQPPQVHTATPQPGPEQKLYQNSWWLRRVVADLHVSTTLVWTVVWLINLGILVWVIYFLLYRIKSWTLPGTMKNRSRTIRRRLAEAEEAVAEAGERLRSIEARLAGVQSEVQALQAQTLQEAELEYGRLSVESAAEAEKIARAATRQIESAGKTARQELRHYAAELAVARAELRLRREVNDAVDEELVRQAAGHFAAGRTTA